MIKRLRLLLAAAALSLPPAAFGQVSIPQNTIVTENFNAIGSSGTAALPSGWRMSPSGNAVGTWSAGVTTTTQAASNGTPATGGRYNWATIAGTDRAVGFLTDGSYNAPNALMVHYRNTTGASVNSITIAFSLERYLVNTGSFALSFASSTDGTTWTPQTGGDISTGIFASGALTATFGNPLTVNKTLSVGITVPNNGDVYFRWTFTTTNTSSQGLGLDNVSVYAGTATPVLTATLKDLLQVDNGIQGQFNEGDVIRYHTVIKNIGSGAASNVQISIPPPSNTTFVSGSIKTSAVAVDDKYGTSFNTMLNGATVLVNDFGVPTPTAVLAYGPTSDATLFNAGVAGTTDAGGSITLTAAGTFTYTPPTGFSGVDYFKYITGNGNLPNNDAIVTIQVAPDISFTTSKTDPSCNGGGNGSITFNASGGNGTLAYSITGTAGTYQASNVFSGLTAGTYNLAVKDAGGYIKTGTETLNNPDAIVVSGDIPSQVYNTAMTPVTFTKTGGSGTITWSISGQPAGITINASTGQVSGTPTQTGSFTAAITATDINGCTGTINDAITVAPNLTNDTYSAVVGNTQLVADAHSAPTTPYTSSATNILSNDASDAAIAITPVTNTATANGGIITIGADGKFTYSPPTGAITSDSYTYTATSGGISATATISFTIADKVWYVNNTYAGTNGTADGRSHRPFTTLDAAATASAAGQYIYVHTGTGNTTGNAVLKSSQVLRGSGSTFTVGALTITSPGTRPTLSGMITLANSVTADGFDMNTGATTAIASSGATSVNVSVNSITTTGATNAVSLANTTGTVTVAGGTQTNSTSSTFNISGGSVSLSYSGGITQAASAAMVNVAGGHTGTLTFNTGTLSASAGTGLQFDNADGSYTFSGTTTLNGGDAGIDIINGSAGTFNFGAGTSITNPSGTAFNVDGTAVTVTSPITFSGNITKNNAGSLLNVTNHGIGTVLFQTGTLSANTASTGNGLQFSNADGSYNFTGTTTLNGGDAGIDILAGSGGTFSFNASTAITNPTGNAINITASAANVTYTGTFSKTNNATTGISVTNNTGGTVAFNGTSTKTLTTQTANAINLTSNTGATVNFSGNNLLITTTTGVGLNATGGGTISITGTGNTVSAGSGTAVNIQNTTIGASGILLKSVASSGAVNGIVLSNTGAGSFSVIGDGTSDASNTTRGRTTAKSGGGTVVLGSGGTLSSTTGTAISLTNATNVVLRNLTIQNGSSSGIIATGVSGLILDNMLVSGKTLGYGLQAASSSTVTIVHSEFTSNATDASIPALDIRNVAFDNVSGTQTVSSSLFQNAAEHVMVLKNTSGTTTFNVTNCTFSGAQAGDGLDIYAYGTSNITANVQNITSSGNSAFGFDSGTETTQSGSLNLTLTGSSFSSNFVGASVAHGSSGTNTFSITNNNFQNHSSISINVNRLGSVGFTGFGLFSGTVSGNTIGTAGVANSGSSLGSNTIDVKTNGSGGTIQVAILNNTIREIGNDGIRVIGRDAPSSTGGHTLHAKIQGNNIANFHASALSGIRAELGAASSDRIVMCLNVNSNTVVSAPQNGVRVRSVTGGTPPPICILTMPGWDGSGATYLANQNPAATGLAGNTSFTNGNTGSSTSAGTCTTPN